MKQSREFFDIMFILIQAIKKRRLIRFYYESDSRGKKEWRTAEPYLIGIKDRGNGNFFLLALEQKELSKDVNKRNTGHYLLSKIDIQKLEVLQKTFAKPKVRREQIDNTPEIRVVYRYLYPDE